MIHRYQPWRSPHDHALTVGRVDAGLVAGEAARLVHGRLAYAVRLRIAGQVDARVALFFDEPVAGVGSRVGTHVACVLDHGFLNFVSKFGFSAMTYAHVGYITKFLWGQRRPPGDSEIEQQSVLSKYLIPYLIISTLCRSFLWG